MSIPVGSNLTLRSVRTEYDPQRGRFDVRTFEGTKEAIFGLVPTLATDQGYVIDDSEAPLYRVTVRTPNDDQGAASPATDNVNTWELLGNEIQKDIYENKRSLSQGPELLALVKKSIKDIEASDNPLTARNAALVNIHNQVDALILAGKLPIDGHAVAEANAINLLDLVIKGTTNYVLSQYVLRKTQTVSSRAQLAFSYNAVDAIFTTAQVITSEQIPDTLLFSLKNIQTQLIDPAIKNSGYQWGWLKKSPTVHQFGAGKYQIIQEYWLEEWTTYSYDLVA